MYLIVALSKAPFISRMVAHDKNVAASQKHFPFRQPWNWCYCGKPPLHMNMFIYIYLQIYICKYVCAKWLMCCWRNAWFCIRCSVAFQNFALFCVFFFTSLLFLVISLFSCFTTCCMPYCVRHAKCAKWVSNLKIF